MALIDWLRGRKGGSDALSGAIRIGGAEYNTEWSHTRVLNSVYRNPTGRRVIERNAYEFMRPSWAVYNSYADRKPVENASVLKLLGQPQPNMTGTMMQYHIRRDLDMNGGTFWLKQRGQDGLGDTGPVTGLKRLAPQRMAVISNEDDDLVGFVYVDRKGNRAPLTVEEVIYINLPDGERQWDRCAPGVTAGLPADIDNSAMKFNAELLAGDGGLPGYLIIEGLTVPQFNSWKSAWKAEENPGKTRFLQSNGANGKGGATYVRVAVSNQEMMYDKLRDYAQDDICRSLGYPGVLLNPDGTTFANMDTARRTWIVGDVYPFWIWVRDHFTMALQSEIASGQKIGFDLTEIEELADNLDAIVERGVALVAAHAMTINELRDELGLPPVAWGNDFPQAPVLANQTGPGESDDEDPETDPEKLPKPTDKPIKVLDPAAVTLKSATAKAADEANQPFAGFFSTVTTREDSAKAALQSFFIGQGEAIVKKLESRRGKAIRKALADWWDGEKWNEELASVWLNQLGDTTDAVGKLALGTFAPDSEFDKTSANITKYLDNRSLEISTLMNGTTSEDVRDVLAEIASEGGSIDDMVDAVREYFGYEDGGVLAGNSKASSRAATASRTEVIGAANFAALQGAKQSNVVSGKTWSAAPDAEADCAALNGTTVGLDESFGAVDAPPLHPNCRCTLTFELSPEFQI